MKNGARSDHAAISPPSAGPLIPPSRKPPLNRPLARPRWLPGSHAHVKLAGESRNGRGDDAEPECDRERYRGEDRHFRRQIAEQASPGTKHETALCQLIAGYQRGQPTRTRRPGPARPP